MNFKSLKDIDVAGQRVLLRADLNVPAQRGRVTDTTRIDRLKPTIDYLRDAGAKILVLSHFGRPEGEQNPEMSLAFLLPTLEQRWGAKVAFTPNCIGEKAEKASANMENGDILLLENVRFHKGEKANSSEFIAQLAKLGDIYVNDAFSAAHRAHATTEGLARSLPSAAGILMEKELTALDSALENPEKPVLAITGGSKISSKLNVLNNLIERVDYLVLGGGMANTFMNAKGIDIGSSLCEHDMSNEARAIMDKAEKLGCEIILPQDCVVVSDLQLNAPHDIVDAASIPSDKMAIDIGPETNTYIRSILEKCKTVVWNGPMGVFEIKPFDRGTNRLAEDVAALTRNGTLNSIAGGGDTVAALENAGVTGDFTYISSAGGAFLEWLEGKSLPGVAALEESKEAA
ncbi:MAG: phosphoglycerate kinase [Micavibrio sp. TMED27]|nr:phosphoglycerate kinase [Micavibrio sp.]OUT91919.1 MAG: phosphoglycerate kinase [Micavibrio sp. TMED27]